MRALITLCWVLVLAPQFAGAVLLVQPESETLPNGLTIRWYPNDKLPLVDIVLAVKSGYRDDPAGKTGVSELLGNTLDRGAAGLSSLQISERIESLGANHWISADEDTFNVGFHGLSQDAPELLDILSKMVLKPEFGVADVARERERLLDRWNHIGDYGETLAGLVFHRLISRGTDYGRGNFLSIEEFKAVKREDVIAFHRKHFTPKNSILMIVGRVDRASFGAKVKSAFAQWSGGVPTRVRTKFSDKRLPDGRGSILVVDRPNLNQAQVRLGFRAPLLGSPDHYSLRVGNALLGEYFHSRLNRVVRDELGLTYGISSSFAFSREFAHFVIQSATRNEAVGQLIDHTSTILKELKTKGAEDSEVKLAKEYLQGGFPLSVATLTAIATRRLTDEVFGLPADYLDRSVDRVAAVDLKQVNSALARNFDLEGMVTVIAGDAKAIIKGLTPEQRKRVKQVSVSQLR